MYMENVRALLGDKKEMKRVMRYLIEELCSRAEINSFSICSLII